MSKRPEPMISPAVVGYLRIPPVWIGDKPTDEELLRAPLTDLIRDQHSRTLCCGIRVRVRRDGIFLFDFSDWPQAVQKLISRPEGATLIRVIAVAGNNDSRARNCRVYCCADALPTRVFTQPGPLADIAHETVRYSLRVRPHSVKWSRGWVAHRQISSIKSGPRPIVPVPGRIRGRMPIVLPMSATGGEPSGDSRINLSIRRLRIYSSRHEGLRQIER